MTTLSTIYRTSLSLLTDLYEVTMAYGYWKKKKHLNPSVFHFYFREAPFNGGFTVSAGLGDFISWMEQFRFTQDDLDYLSTLRTKKKDRPLFEENFLSYLGQLRLSLNVDAVPEGCVVFPHQPLVRVEGALLEAQLIETALLNFFNFQTLIATKAARICLSAQKDPVFEFGLRRAQGVDGGLSASKACYLAGTAATSNLLAGKLFNIPVVGTHAHSWIMSFASELEAFEAYSEIFPDNNIFLIDTYDTLSGIRNAITVGKKIRAQGGELLGVRLDSGDLTYLSQEARRLLDEAGFERTFILGSNDLDEGLISNLKAQGARISAWGVGSKLVTAFDQPALGGVYKLSALKHSTQDKEWTYRIKISDQIQKISTPGILQIKRFKKNDSYVGDAIYDIGQAPNKEWKITDPLDVSRRKTFSSQVEMSDLLIPIFKQGQKVYNVPSLEKSRIYLKEELASFHPSIKRFVNPHRYPAGIEQTLFDRKMKMIAREKKWSDQP